MRYTKPMSLVQLKQATTALSSLELQEFARWVKELEADDWDKEIQNDLESGRLEALIQEAEQQYAAGLAKPL